MKKRFRIIAVVLAMGMMLQGCGSGKDNKDNAGNTSIVTENSQNTGDSGATESAGTDTPASAITKDMAEEGVGNYCRSIYGWNGVNDKASGVYLKSEASDEIIMDYISYTGVTVSFRIEKQTGATEISEYDPVIGTSSVVGTVNISDYIGIEISDNTTEGPTETTETPVQKGHYSFKPKVCSLYMRDVFGDVMCDTWFNLVDAVMAGDDTFECPDQYTYEWVMGQFPGNCFPVLTELIDYAYDRSNAVIDGVASFTYKVPKEEAAARIEEFAGQMEAILNEVLEDDYSDFEKVMALYIYFADHYTYDYEKYNRQMVEPIDDTGAIILFERGTGICADISWAYSYLLMQAGVEATVMSGYGSEAHQWSYVRINGKDYHIDPTWVLDDRVSLAYMMMTDEQRNAKDAFDPSSIYITSHYSREHPHSDYVADDESFSEIWDCYLEEFRPDEDKIICVKYEDGKTINVEFDYSGY
ncbi:Transglutaminase-like superfamily protein [Eubacterium ruminantium]|nr:Transglutaminase-like superfamily protein [Eubacterium ruminantium]